MRAACRRPQTSGGADSAGVRLVSVVKSLSVSLVAIIALLLGVYAALSLQRESPAISLESGTLLQTPRPVVDFSLTDQDGRTFTHERLQGRWHLLFAGFTHCPDICPDTLGVMKLVEQQLQQQNIEVGMVFLSVDPERDTPERLQQYVRYFSPSFTGVTGDIDQIDRLCASLGLAYIKNPGSSESEYTVDHTAALVLLNPRGEIAAYFRAPHRLDRLVDDLQRVVPART
jgi:protein SCO1